MATWARYDFLKAQFSTLLDGKRSIYLCLSLSVYLSNTCLNVIEKITVTVANEFYNVFCEPQNNCKYSQGRGREFEACPC